MAVRVMAWMRILVFVYCEPDLRDLTLGQGHDTPWAMDNNCVKYYQDPAWQ